MAFARPGLLGVAQIALAVLVAGGALTSLAGGDWARLGRPDASRGFAAAYDDDSPGSWQIAATAARASAGAELAPGQPYCFEFSPALAHPGRLGSARWRPFSYAVQWLQFSLQPRTRRECGSGIATIAFAEPARITVVR